jgi:hypothetical protein
MRLFIVNLIAVGLLTFTAGTASAVTLTLAGADGQTVAIGDQVTVTMTLDTEATVGITLLSIGVLFDDTKLVYLPELSTSNSGSGYILYGTAKNGGAYLSAAITCGGGYGSPTAGAGCQLALPGQVNADYVNGDLTNGTGSTNVGVAQMATFVFEVIAEAEDGMAFIDLTQTAPGNVVGQPGGGSTTATLFGGDGGDGTGFVQVPEPGLAGLALAAILTVGGLRTRERRRR